MRQVIKKFKRWFPDKYSPRTGRVTNVNHHGIAFIKSWEGFEAYPYLDTGGVPTIGYGTTYYPNGRRVTMRDNPISERKATQYMYKNLKNYVAAVDAFTRDDLTQNQFNALVSFCYNVGERAFQRSTLLKRINLDLNHPDIEKQFKRWVYDEGKFIRGLKNRRVAEYNLYRTETVPTF